MISKFDIRGYALISDDDKIAPADGQPYTLRNSKDWEYYQGALRRADLLVFGSVSHKNEPYADGQRRLVISRRGTGLEQRADGWWWDPERVTWSEAASKALPQGGLVAVCGGQMPFDLFLDIGFDEFHLSRFRGMQLPGGRAIFSACENSATSAEMVLTQSGLKNSERIAIDPVERVEMNIWRRLL